MQFSGFGYIYIHIWNPGNLKSLNFNSQITRTDWVVPVERNAFEYGKRPQIWTRTVQLLFSTKLLALRDRLFANLKPKAKIRCVTSQHNDVYHRKLSLLALPDTAAPQRMHSLSIEPGQSAVRAVFLHTVIMCHASTDKQINATVKD